MIVLFFQFGKQTPGSICDDGHGTNRSILRISLELTGGVKNTKTPEIILGHTMELHEYINILLILSMDIGTANPNEPG